eukprot:TRINITY_DN26596_c0_g2_i5.p1 TRINITY_DN26596_c0_g2~~TRINITY_DN26596_c0_g2_i5.p1  ORF type:complete len:487 (-),score=83.24 TRINITY_DN26596_c0_g2_i5:264-1724(-)
MVVGRVCFVSRVHNVQFPLRKNRCQLAKIRAQVQEQAIEIQQSDKFVDRVLDLSQSMGNGAPLPIQPMIDDCKQIAQNLQMPNNRVEDYRFTDIKFITDSNIQNAENPDDQQIEQILQQYQLEEADQSRIIVVNGNIENQFINTKNLPQGIKVSNLGQSSQEIQEKIGEFTKQRGGPFTVLNGVHVRDVLCIEIEKNVRCDVPLHILYVQNQPKQQNRLSLSSPRLFVFSNEDSYVEIIEEFVTIQNFENIAHVGHVVNQVAEIFLAPNAEIRHGIIQMISENSACTKSTLVEQSKNSSYSVLEACVGGKLVRHDLNILQTGDETKTKMRHFILCGANQLHDLHSKLRLQHPFGEADQLHKCIVTHSSGRGVFDGNVKVERKAQKTDAQQLSRNLLLVPKATVNVKPNLQIIADDVKCTHGCAVSDLSDDEIFYLQSRGIDKQMARQALVYSFGGEIVKEFGYEQVSKRIQERVDETLRTVELIQD